MQFPRDMVWLIPLFPLLGALVNGLTGFVRVKLPKRVVGFVACASMFAAFVVSCATVRHLAQLPEGQRQFVDFIWRWIHIGPLKVDLAFLVDPLSAVMILIVTGIGFLIHLYSVGYMHEDAGYQRYMAYLNFFVFFMLLLVLGENVLVMFVGWEGVGLCSYLLIGFWFKERPNAAAGMKAFVVNRIGDFAFICGFALLYWALSLKGHGTLSFIGLRENAYLLEGMTVGGIAVATLVTLLFFIGATGKSAQIPLYVWLPDAMAGPTPVSALIHAATMVTAGVYMIARNNFLYTMSPVTLDVVATVGVLTAFFAGTIGLAQNDIKKVLAYSTVSQLGYMFLGMGVGAYAAGVMHLMTHAFFKGLLFLGAGSVIHALHHEQDMRHMGGLRHKIPWTFRTFTVAFIAIIGIPPLAGFVSKDEILWKTFASGNYGRILWFVGFLTAGMTALYMSRLYFMTFFGKYRGEKADDHHHGHDKHHGHGHHEIHESPWIMVGPLCALAVLSAVGGFVGWPHALGGHNHFEKWLEPVFTQHSAGHERVIRAGEGVIITMKDAPAADAGEHGAASPEDGAHGGEAAVAHEAGHHANPMEYVLMVLSVGLACGAVWLGFQFYGRESGKPKELAAKFPRAHRALLNKYYVDEFYDATVVRGLLAWNAMLAWIDSHLVDGLVNFVGKLGILVSAINGAFDRIFVDGMVNGVASVSRGVGGHLRQIQTGKIQNYVYVAVATVTLAIVMKILF